MQNTSSAYKTAIRKSDRPYDEVYGTITFSASTGLSPLTVNASNIPEGQLSWIRQCITDDELEFGGVFLGTIEMSIYNSTISRYAFYGARLELDYRINVSDTDTPSYEVIHIGKFTISEADRPDNNTIKFSAYDDMKLLDKAVSADAISGTPYDILAFISEECDYPLAFDEQFIEDNFTNINTNIYLDSASGIKTYRDAVKIVCQNLGCFAQDDRTGQMELRNFSTTPCCTIKYKKTDSDVYSCTIAEYTCHYVGLTVTSAKGTFSSISSTEDVGNIMQIPDAPAWDYGVLAELQLMTDRLFDKLNDIVYTPCEISMPSDVSFDCGDRILIDTDNDDVETIITSYEWKWHGGMEISSKGVNPYEQGVSTSDIASTRLLNKETAQSKFTYYTYTNAGNITLTTSFQRLYRIRFTVGDTTTVTLWHELKMLNTLAEENQVITLNYYLDGIKFDREPVHTYGESGYHTLGNQFFLQDVEAGEAHEWEVRAKINSGTAIVNRGDLIAVIQGQNLAPSDKFNGEITIEEEFTPIRLHRRIVPLGENLDIELTEPYPNLVLSDSFIPIRLRRRIVGLAENMSITREKEQFYLVTEDGDNLATEDGDLFIT